MAVITTLQSRTGPVHTGPEEGFPCVVFPHRENLFSLEGSQVMKIGFSLLEILHREIPVFITGMGLQCTPDSNKVSMLL